MAVIEYDRTKGKTKLKKSGYVWPDWYPALAVLRTTSVPRRILGPKKRVGAHAGCHGRMFILQAAGSTAVVFQQHRLSLYPPSGTPESRITT